MKTEQFFRKPFDVNAVQVTPQNCAEIAEWCGGEVSKSTYKIAGFDTQMDSVKVPGSGANKDKKIVAKIGWWVVELDGKFRVYRDAEFQQTFHAYVENRPFFKPGDKVEDKTDGRQGTVVFVDQVLVDYGMLGNVLHDRSELTWINKFSEATEKRLAEEAARSGDNALDKINALRAEAETAVMSGELSTHEAITEAFESSETIANIGDIKVGTVVRVVDEMNEFFSLCGPVVEFINDNCAKVRMECAGGIEQPEVNHLIREIQVESETKWARVINPNSAQHGWVGWVVEDKVDSDLTRLAFRPTSYLMGARDRCFSYMADEVELVTMGDSDQVPVYEI